MPSIDVRTIAFYLPQFHPIPENDKWWGKGFTEWTNVTKARPLFPGHYQPHLPADLGFYDLRLPEARQAQADLAREYGIHGFCYYHYWFNGRRILERPFNEVLASGKPDFPFCLCWANENWTRAWDGGESNTLLSQNYTHEDDRFHIQSLIPVFEDPRYIRVNGKPLFLVYRTGLLPSPRHTAEVWREEVERAGLGDICLVRVESHADITDPTDIGFNASVEFAPFNGETMPPMAKTAFGKFLLRLGLLEPAFQKHAIFDYRDMAISMMRRPDPSFTRFHCVSPGWDNTARRKDGGMILTGQTPNTYQDWLLKVIDRTRQKYTGDERIIFINAWNEWAEGNHLEPDMKWGRAFLEATRDSLNANCVNIPVTFQKESTKSHEVISFSYKLRALYWNTLNHLNQFHNIKLLKYVSFPCLTFFDRPSK